MSSDRVGVPRQVPGGFGWPERPGGPGVELTSTKVTRTVDLKATGRSGRQAAAGRQRARHPRPRRIEAKISSGSVIKVGRRRQRRQRVVVVEMLLAMLVLSLALGPSRRGDRAGAEGSMEAINGVGELCWEPEWRWCR